jgi:hypothetical protein
VRHACRNRFADWVINGPPDTPPNEPRPTNASPSSDFPAGDITPTPSKRTFARAVKDILKSVNQSIFSARTVAFDQQTRGVYVGVRADTAQTHIASLDELNIDKLLLTKISRVLVTEYVADLIALSPGETIDTDYLETVLQERTDVILASLSSPRIVEDPSSASLSSSAEVPSVEIGHGTAAHEYFGSSVTVADFQGKRSDRACDLLVGSYGSGRTGGPQEGSARILFDAACDVFTSNSSVVNKDHDSVNKTLLFRGGMNHGLPLPSYERFGYATASMDVNSDGYTDAIICAPSFGGRNVSEVVGNYSGRCDIFLGPFEASHGNCFKCYEL